MTDLTNRHVEIKADSYTFDETFKAEIGDLYERYVKDKPPASVEIRPLRKLVYNDRDV